MGHLNPKKGRKIPENRGVGIRMGEDQKEENRIIGDVEEGPAARTRRDFLRSDYFLNQFR